MSKQARRSRLLNSSVFTVALTTGLASAAIAQPLAEKTDAFLKAVIESRAASGWTSVVVRLDRHVIAPQESALRALRADVYRHLPIIDSAAMRVPTRNLARLAALPFVRHLSSDIRVRKCDEFTVDSSGAGAALAQYGCDGTGIAVAVIDSGVRGTAAFNQLKGTSLRLITGVSLVPGDTSPTDKCGHGTHVAGIIGSIWIVRCGGSTSTGSAPSGA